MLAQTFAVQKRHFVMHITDGQVQRDYLFKTWREDSMRKHLRFAVAAAAVGVAMIALARAGDPVSTHEVVRPKVELAAEVANPNLPFQVLRPIY